MLLIRCIILLCGLTLFVNSATATELQYLEKIRQVKNTPSLGKLNSYILFEPVSQTIILANNENEPFASASLTKLMTVYIIAEELTKQKLLLSEKVKISAEAWGTIGSRMFVKNGSEVKVEDLVKGIVVQSGNDASVAIAQHISGDEHVFANLMNQTATNLKLSKSKFFNSSGLDTANGDSNVMSALDVALLSRQLILRHESFYKKYFSQKFFTHNKIKQKNRNNLLWIDESIDGLKTGHTKQAGYSLAASADKSGMRLIAVVMGARSEKQREENAYKLLRYGFRNYQLVTLIKKNPEWKKLRVWGGSTNYVEAGLQQDLKVLIPHSEERYLSATLQIAKPLQAPILINQQVGNIEVYFQDNKINTAPIYSSQAIPQGNFFKVWLDNLRVWLKK